MRSRSSSPSYQADPLFVFAVVGRNRCRRRLRRRGLPADGLLLHGNVAVKGTAAKDHGDASPVQRGDGSSEDRGRQKDQQDLLDIRRDAKGEGAGELVADQAGDVEAERHEASRHHPEGGPEGGRRRELRRPPLRDGGNLACQAGQEEALKGGLGGHLVQQIDGMQLERSGQDLSRRDSLRVVKGGWGKKKGSPR